MLAFALPVPWRDVNQQGLGGVVEIHNSDFREKKVEQLVVRDVIAIVNKKVQEDSSNRNILREVGHLMLHGVRVNNNYLQEYLIPELVGSSPRLVATTQIRVNRMQGTAMMVFIKTLTGKTATVDCTSTDTVNYVKTKIEDKEGIPTEAQRLMYAGKQLRDHLTLSFYNVENESTLYLSVRIIGGFSGHIPASRTFADVSDESLITAIAFSNTAPEWRRCSEGLNIEGRCENPECRAFRQMIIDRKKFTIFNLIRDDNIRCPICRWRVKPVTCGLYDFAWRFEGVKINDGLSISSQWQDARGYVYHRFDADETNGSVGWASLLMVVKPPNELVLARLLLSTEPIAISKGDICTICWSPFGSPVKKSTITTHCGHNFHRVCSDKWAKWCKHTMSQPSCPICRRTT